MTTSKNDTKMLQAILSGQQAIKEELKNDIKKVREELGAKIDRNSKQIKENTKRIDKVFYEVANLSDSAVDVEEFDELKEDYIKFKQKFAS